MRRMYVDTPLGQLHVTMDSPADADAEPLVLLNSRTRSLLALLPLIKPRFYGVIVDCPGMAGQSFVPQMGVTMPEVGECLLPVLDALDIDKARIFGIHTGHKIACGFAAQHPERVEKLIIAGKTHSIVPDRIARNAAMQGYTGRRPGDTLVVALEGKYLDQPEVAAGNEAIYNANFNFELAHAVAKIPAETLVLEITSKQEDAEIGRQAEALASLSPNGRATSLPQLEPYGLDLYAGAENIAEIIVDFMSAK